MRSALGVRDALGRAGRGRGARPRCCGASSSRVEPRRAGRADGPQRRRQEHPAAGGGGPGRAARGRHRRRRAGVALLPQSPGDLLRPRAGRRRAAAARPGAAALRRGRARGLADADPRDLSGGERQRLALAIVVAGRGPADGELPGACCLDEPTRGMDRARKDELAELDSGARRRAAPAVMIATHDVEFAATFADRVVLLGERRGDRRRTGRRDALRRLVLRDRGRADPRRRRRDHRRAGRRAALRADAAPAQPSADAGGAG